MSFLRRWLLQTNMSSAECRRVAKILQHYLDGEGTPEAAKRVERHLDACRDCGFEAEALIALKDAVRRFATADPSARARLQMFAGRLARGEIDITPEPSS